MLRAAIDIGSQSVLLLIAEVEGDEIKTIREEFYSPRLGQGLTKSGSLRAEATKRAEMALRKALRLCRRHGAESIVAAGTAALREPGNSAQFIAGIKDRLGIEIRVLNGKEEAYLAFLGAVSHLDVPDMVAVLDVGGGSTECTVGFCGRPSGTMSAPVGAVKLKDRFGRSPGLNAHAMQELEVCLRPITALARELVLIGVGGSVTTLAAVKLGLREYDADAVSSCTLSLDELDALIGKFRSLSLESIKALPGMDRPRADIIESGATIVQAFMASAGSREIRVSSRGLRHGLLLEELRFHQRRKP